MTRKRKKDLEKKIANEAKSNPKKFWRYVREKLRTKVGIADLITNKEGEPERLTTTDTEKAQKLAEFFSSVFTREPPGEVPTPATREYDRPLGEFNITAEGIRKKAEQTEGGQVTRSG